MSHHGTKRKHEDIEVKAVIGYDPYRREFPILRSWIGEAIHEAVPCLPSELVLDILAYYLWCSLREQGPIFEGIAVAPFPNDRLFPAEYLSHEMPRYWLGVLYADGSFDCARFCGLFNYNPFYRLPLASDGVAYYPAGSTYVMDPYDFSAFCAPRQGAPRGRSEFVECTMLGEPRCLVPNTPADAMAALHWSTAYECKILAAEGRSVAYEGTACCGFPEGFRRENHPYLGDRLGRFHLGYFTEGVQHKLGIGDDSSVFLSGAFRGGYITHGSVLVYPLHPACTAPPMWFHGDCPGDMSIDRFFGLGMTGDEEHKREFSGYVAIGGEDTARSRASLQRRVENLPEGDIARSYKKALQSPHKCPTCGVTREWMHRLFEFYVRWVRAHAIRASSGSLVLRESFVDAFQTFA